MDRSPSSPIHPGAPGANHLTAHSASRTQSKCDDDKLGSVVYARLRSTPSSNTSERRARRRSDASVVALPLAQISDKMGMQSLRQRRWFVQPSCAASGEGLFEGLDWIAGSINANLSGNAGG